MEKEVNLSEKNIAIEFLRFYFMMIICLWHFDSCVGLFHHGYIPVDFFFILSGFLMYNSAKKKDCLSVGDYTYKKIKRFYPEYLIVLLLFWTLHLVSKCIGGDKIVFLDLFVGFLSELTFLQQVGIATGAINVSCWYLSVLVWGGALVYSLIKHYHRFSIAFLFPIIIVLVYTAIFSCGNSVECWINYGPFHMPLWRGIADMCLGCILNYSIANYIKVPNKLVCIIDIFTVFSFAGTMIDVVSDRCVDVWCLLFFCFIITDAFIPHSLLCSVFNGKVSTFLGGLSYEMLLLNWPLVYILKWMNSNILLIPYPFLFCVYVILLLLSSYMLKYFYISVFCKND